MRKNGNKYVSVICATCGKIYNKRSDTMIKWSGATVVPPNTGIYFKLTMAAIGTSQTLNVHVVGFYGP